MINLIKRLLPGNGYNHIDFKDVELQLLSHPEYPSVRSITDTLDYFGIENLAAEVPKDAFDQLPENFLALTEKEKVSELLFAERKNGSVFCTNENNQRTKLLKDVFLEQWTGVILAVEKTAIETKTRVLSGASIEAFLFLALIVTTGFVIASSFTVTYTLYSLFAFLGLWISYFIVKENMGIHTIAVSKVCGAISNNPSGCTDVINSNKAKLFNKLSFSDLCITFFIAISVSLLTIGFDHSFLYAISIASIPVILISLYVQGVVLKEWCAMCLVIGGILTAQFILLYLTFTSWQFSATYVLQVGLIGLISMVGWITFKKLWKDSLNLKMVTTDFLKFKRNPKIFGHLLRTKRVNDLEAIPKEHRLLFGNHEADLEITGVINPLCGFCNKAFQAYGNLLEKYPEKILLNLVFSITNNPKNPDTKIASQVIEMYREDPLQAFRALADWFENKEIDSWLTKYNGGGAVSQQISQTIEAHVSWCKVNEIHYTPSTLIAGYIFPQEYDIQDITLFMEDIETIISEPKIQPNATEALA